MARTEKRYADNPAYEITLNDDQLQTFGKIFAVWGQIDFQIIRLLAHILKIPYGAAVTLLDNVTSGTLLGYLRKNLSKVEANEDRIELKGFCERGRFMTMGNAFARLAITSEQKLLCPTLNLTIFAGG